MTAAIVDLLPPELAARRRDRRLIVWTAMAVAAFVGVLAGIYAVQVAALQDATAARDAIASRVATREERVAALAPYAELAARLEARDAVLQTAMAPEVSWSRLLTDVAQALPRDASLQTLAATTGDAAGAGAAQPAPAADGAAAGGAETAEAAIGRIDVTGYSTAEVSPGVRSVVERLPGVRGLVDPYLSTATATDLHGAPVTTFTLAAELDDGVRSHRYDDGLPPEGAR